MNDIKNTAKEIRATLKKEFPATKFSVTIKRFSMGESVETSWTDGPTRPQVDALIGGYGDTRYRFINTSRKHSIEFADKVIKVWKEQNLEYAHLVVTSKGEVNCYSLEVSDSEFDTNNNILQSCSDSVYKLLRNSTLETLSLATPPKNADCEPQSVSAPEPEKTAEVVIAETVSQSTEVSVTITRIDGKTLEQYADETLATVTVTGWAQAESVVQDWASTVSGSFDTCDVTINFPGEQAFKSYKTSYNIEPFDAVQPKLLKHVKMELQFIAGQHPDDMEDDHYEAWKAYYQPADVTKVAEVNYLLETFIYPAITTLTSEFEFTVSEGSTCSHPEFNVIHAPTGYDFKVWKSATQGCWVNTIYTLTEDRGYSYEYGFTTPQFAAANAVKRIKRIDQLQSSCVDLSKTDALEIERQQVYAQYITSWQEADALEAKLAVKRKESQELGKKLEEVKAKIEAKRLEKARANRPPKASEITLTRVEGPSSLCRKPVVVTTFAAADKVLRQWARTAPDDGAYDKCDITLNLATGSVHKTRFDLTRAHVFGSQLQEQLEKQLNTKLSSSDTSVWCKC